MELADIARGMAIDRFRATDLEGERKPDGSPEHCEYDAINEIWFASRDDYDAYMQLAARPDVRALLVADEARFIEPNCCFRELRYRAAPSTAEPGSSGFTPSPCAVEGMNCMRPWAPACETAPALNPDSCDATAARSDGATPYLAPACWNRFA